MYKRDEHDIYTALTQPAMFGPLPVYYLFGWLLIVLATQLIGFNIIISAIISLVSLILIYLAAQKEPRYLEMLIVKIRVFGLQDALGMGNNEYNP